MNIRTKWLILMAIVSVLFFQGCGDEASNPEQTQEGTPLQEETDQDKDGVGDLREVLINTDPANPDTDNDNAGDGDEVLLGSNPGGGSGASKDSDKDNFSDKDEVDKFKAGSSLAHPAIFNGLRADVYDFGTDPDNNPSIDAVLTFIEGNSPKCRDAISLFSSNNNGLDFRVESDGTLNRVSGFGNPSCGGLTEKFAIHYTANLFIPNGGTALFEFEVNDGAVIFLDFKEVARVSTGSPRSANIVSESGSVERLTPGIHILEIVFFHLQSSITSHLGFRSSLRLNGSAIDPFDVMIPFGLNAEVTQE